MRGLVFSVATKHFCGSPEQEPCKKKILKNGYIRENLSAVKKLKILQKYKKRMGKTYKADGTVCHMNFSISHGRLVWSSMHWEKTIGGVKDCRRIRERLLLIPDISRGWYGIDEGSVGSWVKSLLHFLFPFQGLRNKLFSLTSSQLCP